MTTGLGRSPDQASSHTAALSVTTQVTRESGPTLGLTSAGVVDKGLAFRNLTLHVGYDWLAKPGWFALESGLDLGGGEPVTCSFSGIGAYFGTSNTARFQLTSGGDRERTFNVLYPILDFVLTSQVGLWGPPEGANNPDPVVEYGFALGIRAAFASDVVAPRIGAQQDGERSEKAKPWRK